MGILRCISDTSKKQHHQILKVRGNGYYSEQLQAKAGLLAVLARYPDYENARVKYVGNKARDIYPNDDAPVADLIDFSNNLRKLKGVSMSKIPVYRNLLQ